MSILTQIDVGFFTMNNLASFQEFALSLFEIFFFYYHMWFFRLCQFQLKRFLDDWLFLYWVSSSKFFKVFALSHEITLGVIDLDVKKKIFRKLDIKIENWKKSYDI